MGDVLSDLFTEPAEFGSTHEDLLRMLETLEEAGSLKVQAFSCQAEKSCPKEGCETIGGNEEVIMAGKGKKRSRSAEALDDSPGAQLSPSKMSHIAVERNRRKQMNEHLTILRSLMPCFYVKRGDQASIIGGVVDYIKELQQLLQSLEAKKQRKVLYSEVLSPRSLISPRLPLSPKPHPLSPRLGFPSPRTPQPGSPYKPKLLPHNNYVPNTIPVPTNELSSPKSVESACADFGAVSSGAPVIPEVKIEFSGPSVLLKTASQRVPGQPLRIITALEKLSLEVLHASISTADDTMLNSFTIKIGIDCELSAEDLVQEIQQTFSS